MRMKEQNNRNGKKIISSSLSVIDCVRLGKFSEDRCRPSLVTMNRPNDVVAILASRARLSQFPRVSIKPDLSVAERRVESILLRERRNLIASGTLKSQIKLRKESLFVNNREYGKVVNSSFLLCPLVSDFIPDAPTGNASSKSNQSNIQPGILLHSKSSSTSPSDTSASTTDLAPLPLPLMSDYNTLVFILVYGTHEA